MKYIITIALALLIAPLSFAEGKDLKLTGKGCCAKCCLKIADACDNVFEVTGKDGKKTKYWVKGDGKNVTKKKAHSFFCKGIKDLAVVGTCKKVGDKLVLTVSKIEKVKK
ncbi:MAG: hypothetical protein QGG55_10135 [Verrucomicrobiota bacterium]|jgi:hypothetical protein|nr:hypothetical protein [Verrucomicrobiota bacterium]|tara:strand:- start:110 stop:439 length:330 start_codon:yes stop_codon:yes gene_type:complete